MIQIAICDDEKYICDFLKKSVTDCLAKADIEGCITVFDDGQPLVDIYEDGKAFKKTNFVPAYFFDNVYVIVWKFCSTCRA